MDENIIVLQNQDHAVVQFINGIDDTELIKELCQSGSKDSTSGTYSSHQLRKFGAAKWSIPMNGKSKREKNQNNVWCG